MGNCKGFVGIILPRELQMKLKSPSFSSKLFIGIFISIVFVFAFSQSKDNNSWFEKSSEIAVNEPENNLLHKELEGFKSETITLASWNIQHLGRSKTPENIYQIATILRDFDIVAIQEVVAKDPAGAQAVAKIADELNRMGAKWDYQISDPTKSPSVNMSERYAFLWKTSKVSMVHRAYLDTELEDLCYREPFIAAFKTKGVAEPFYVVNYHSRKHNDRPEEEIVHLFNYSERLDSNKILIAGDFNLNEEHEVWKPFYHKGFKSALQNEGTTLKRNCKNGTYRNHPIDNVYFASGIKIIQAGSVDFVETCENLQRAREISDHLPVYMEFKIE